MGHSPEASRVGRFVLRGMQGYRGMEGKRAAFRASDQLEIEITENVAWGSPDKITPTLRALREKGVGVAFDDFGTGYASLSCITKYPLTRIKIDRSFVKNIFAGSSPGETAVASSIIVMAHNLGLAVIAEGMETRAQAAFLRGKDCEEVQGYLYARPMPDAEFRTF